VRLPVCFCVDFIDLCYVGEEAVVDGPVVNFEATVTSFGFSLRALSLFS
jgi:hypothetical protein